MNTLLIVFQIAVLGISVVSAIRYLTRRSTSKALLNEFRDGATPIRTLTAGERELLSPLLVNPFRPSIRVPIDREGVFALRGKFHRHGIAVSNGAEQLHDTIAGVEVVLPYDAEAFLQEQNSAQVVLTKKFALVIALNDSFDIAGGAERTRARAESKAQWEAGAAMPVRDASTTTQAAAPTNASEAKIDAPGSVDTVHVITQRDESPNEVLQRRGMGYGILPSLALLCGVPLLVVASGVDGVALIVLSAIAGAMLLVLSLWLARQIPSVAKRRRVNTVRGPLTVTVTHDEAGKQHMQLFLGDKLPVVLPQHWTPALVITRDEPVELDLRVSDYTVVRFGNLLSVDREIDRFPPTRWPRHFAIAISAAGLAITAGIFSWILRADLLHVASVFKRGAQNSVVTDAATLKGAGYEVGTMMHARGNARCSVIDQPGTGLPPDVSCEHLRWGGVPFALGTLPKSAALQSLLDGTFLDARRDNGLELLNTVLGVRRATRSDDSVASVLRPVESEMQLRRVYGAARLVTMLDSVCTAIPASEPAAMLCTRLQQQTVSAVAVIESEYSRDSWSQLLALARGGSISDSSQVIVDARRQKQLASQARVLAEELMREHAMATLNAALTAQRGGVNLVGTKHNNPTRVMKISREDDLAYSVAFTDSRIETQWDNYLAVARGERAGNFDIRGLIVRREANEAGEPLIFVETTRTVGTLWKALLRLALVLLLLTLCVWHASKLVQALRNRSGVKARLDKFVAEQVNA